MDNDEVDQINSKQSRKNRALNLLNNTINQKSFERTGTQIKPSL